MLLPEVGHWLSVYTHRWASTVGPLLSTHQDAPVGSRRQAGSHKPGDEVGCGRAVMPAHPGRQGCHCGTVQVEGTAVRGVGVERGQSCLPELD